jgi:hypothetical protein
MKALPQPEPVMSPGFMSLTRCWTCTAGCKKWFLRVGLWEFSFGRHRRRCWQLV